MSPHRPSHATALRLTSRRSVIKQLAAIGLSVPVILTLTPSEARAQGSGEGS